jgi:hypothetical protein
MGVLYAVDPHRARLLTLQETLTAFLESTDAGPSLVGSPATRQLSSGKPADLVFQFKITLLETKPPIWRRILVRDATLDKLHEHIQSAMGWTNSHLHEFMIGGCRYGDPEYLNQGIDHAECVDSSRSLLSAILPTDGKPFRFKYVYDFGDNWEHEVIGEGSRKPEPGMKYPICIAGARACPPDDVGGVWGFYDYLEALDDPKHDRHEELLDWGGPFNSEAFDAAETTRMMRRRLPKW